MRIDFLDTAKGICILLVVLFHAEMLIGVSSMADQTLFAIRMPLYFFLSGLFFKSYGSWKGFVLKKTNRLLVPFLFFYLLTSVLLPSLLHHISGSEIHTVTGLPALWAFLVPEEFPNIPIWFLWSLFLANLLFFTVHRTCHNRILKAVICLLLGIIGYATWFFDVNFPAFLDNTLYFFPFFVAGHLVGREHLQSIRQSRWMSFACSLVLLFLTWLIYSPAPEGAFVFSLIRNWSACLLGTCSVILFAYTIGKIPFITYVGRYSIMLLVSHLLVLECYQKLFSQLTLPTTILFFAVYFSTILSYLVLIPVMRRFLPHVTAQKDLISLS